MRHFDLTLRLPRRPALALLMVAMTVTATMAAEGWPFKTSKFYSVFPNQYPLHDEMYDFTVYHAVAPGLKPELWPGAKLSAITLFDDPETITSTIVVGLTLDLSTSDANYQTLGHLSFDGPCDLVRVLFFDKTPMISDGEAAVEIYTYPGEWFQPTAKSMKVTLFISLPEIDFITFVNHDAEAILPAITELSEWVEEPVVASLVFAKPQPVIRHTLLDMGVAAGLLRAPAPQPKQQPATQTKPATPQQPAAQQPAASTQPLDACGHLYVDLALPSGTMWAVFNLGAERPRLPGTYFSWGELAGKQAYPCDNETYITNEQLLAGGYIDADGRLTAAHDAAQAHWGGSWRLPTVEEVQELFDNCDVFFRTGGGDCYEFRSRINGNGFVIPVSGFMSSSGLDYQQNAYIWTSTVNRGGEAMGVQVSDSGPRIISEYTYKGLQVHPVMGPGIKK